MGIEMKIKEVNLTSEVSDRKVTENDLPCIVEYTLNPEVVVLMVKEIPSYESLGFCLKDGNNVSFVGKFIPYLPLSHWRKVDPKRTFEISN